MKNTTTIGVWSVLALAGVGVLPAQGRADLQRAVVIEEEERDLARAAGEYRRLAQEATDAAVRAEAGVRLGGVLLAMGKKDEARAVLAPLAQGEGEVGARARGLLSDTQQDDPVFAARARAAVGRAQGVQALGEHEVVFAELAFLGQGVVPYLMAAIRAGKVDPSAPAVQPVDRRFLDLAVRVMCRVGGAAAADGLRELAQHGDVVVRRTCVEAIYSALTRDLLPAAQVFLADRDPTVRRAALDRIGSSLDDAGLARLMQDLDESVREKAFDLMGQRGWADSGAELAAAVTGAIRAELAHEVPVSTISSLLTRADARTEERRVLWLALLRHPRAHVQSSPDWRDAGLAPNAHADDLVATAEVLAARGDRGRLESLPGLAAAALSVWNGDALPQVLRLLRCGVGFDCERWLATNARPEHLPTLLDHLDVLPLGQNILGPSLAAQDLPRDAWKPIAAVLDRPGVSINQVYWLASLALRTRADEGVALVRALANDAYRYQWIVQLLGEQKEPTTAMVDAMAELLQLDMGAGNGAVTPRRGDLFSLIAGMHDEARIPALVAACALPIHADAAAQFAVNGQAKAGMPDRFAALLMDACLSARHGGAFRIAERLVQSRGSLGPELSAVLGKHAFASPRSFKGDLLLVGSLPFDPAAMRSLYIEAVRSDDAAVFAAAMNMNLPFPIPPEAVPAIAARARDRLDYSAIHRLGQCGDAKQAPLLRELTRHDDLNVRSRALLALADLQGVDAIDALLPAADDPQEGVRKTFATIAIRLLDRRFIPKLLEMLRDEALDNRAEAQKAIEAIEFFHTQTARWQRILADASLDAGSAAEALVKQATGGDKRTRLAAIASLGTLGVAETLPVLIRLMQDGDAEIAAAASAAVAKINGR